MLLAAATLSFGIGLGLGRLAAPGAGAFPVLAAVGTAWVCLVLAMLLPSSAERAGDELGRRLARLRHEINSLGNAPRRNDVLRVIALARELGLTEAEVADELEELRACVAAIDLRASLERGTLPEIEVPGALPPGDRCVFMCPVRFGRRRSDQFGHLLLTKYGVRFRGTIDTSASWHEIRAVQRMRRELVLAVHDSRRQLRFACHTVYEAMEAGVYADYLRTHVEAPAEDEVTPNIQPS